MRQSDESQDLLAELAERSRPAAAVLDLVDVRVRRHSAELVNPNIEPPYVVDTSLTGGLGYRPPNVGIDVEYDLVARSESGADVWHVSVVLHLEYRVDSDDAMPSPESLEAYAITSAPFMAHPFAREIIHSATTRMGVPPFVLPVMKRMGDTVVFGDLTSTEATSSDAAGSDVETPP